MNYNQFFRELMISLVICVILNFVLIWISLPYDNKMTLDYLKHRPFWSGTMVLFLIINMLYFLKKSWYMIYVLLISFILIGVSFISSLKMDKRSDPLVPEDIYLLKESWNMAKKYLAPEQIAFLFSGIIILGIIVVIIWKYDWNQSLTYKLRLVISIICISSLIILSNIRNDLIWNKLGVTNKITTPFHNIQNNGFIMGNFLQLTKKFQQKPVDYSERETESFINELENNSNKMIERESIKPNLIFIQLEAFFDPTILPNVTFSKDPIPFFRSLKERFTNGNLSVNVFGAGTANTEFEVLTSMSMQLFSYETHPFTSHVNKQVDSIAHNLKGYGYKTSGMHNNVGWFYNREDVYPRLGISKALFSEDMNTTNFVYDVPGVPKDKELFKEIINYTSSTKEKDFVIGITMELHGPYYLWQGHDIKVTSDIVSNENLAILEEYAYKLYEVDTALKSFINYYEQSKEPTMIILYGDHLPWLGDEKITYYETGYIDKAETIENFYKMYNTPLLIWDNYRDENKEEITLGSSFLVPYVIKEIGLTGNGLTSFLQQKMTEGIFRLPPSNFQFQEGWTEESIDQYRHLQYYYLTNFPYKKK